MEYNYYIPKSLQGISPVIWELKAQAPTKYMMLPEFNIDLVINLGRPWTIHSDYYNNKSDNPTENLCFLSGLHTKPLLVEFESSHLFGIRLNTVAASLLFGIDCKEFINSAVDGESLLNNRMHYIQEKVLSLPDFTARAPWLEAYIQSLLCPVSDLALAMKISTLMDKLADKKFAGKPVAIEDYTGYSRMHTLRIFQKWFGVAPGEALSFRRFEKAMNLIHNSNDSLTQVGLSCGFYDQPHFVRQFKKFTDLTPSKYAKLRTEKLGHFSL